MTQQATAVRARAQSSGAVIAVAMGVMNVATYGFQVVAARLLGPQQYGAFAAVMNVLLVVSVLSLAVQATAARLVAAHPEDVAHIERSVLAVGTRATAVLGAALLLLSPLVDRLLRLDSLVTAALIAVTAVPITLMGAQAGILQGERRWGALAGVYLAAGLPRLLVGTGLLLWRPDELTAVLAVALTAFGPVLVGYLALRDHRRPRDEDRRGPAVLREIGRSGTVLLAFFALSNVDIIVARNALDAHEAGLYAAGLILAKAALFLPQFVVVVAFPAMARPGGRSRAMWLGIVLVGALGMVPVLGALTLSSLAMVFVGGADYAEIESLLWLFAVLGTMLAMIQLLVYAVLARQRRWPALLPWLALVSLVLSGLRADTVGELLTVMVVVDGALLLALVVVSLWPVRRATGPGHARDELDVPHQ